MSEDLWPLKLLIGCAWLIGILTILALLVAVDRANLPGWLTLLLDSLLMGFLGGGGAVATKRRRSDRNPWSKKYPDRG